MRILSILLVLVATAPAVLAQTNAPEVRSVSLKDCIQEALQRNLDLRIARFGPLLAQQDLYSAYAGWDPTFGISGRHTFTMSEGGFDKTTGTILPSQTTDQNLFGSTLNGLMPWGLNYNLSGSISESYGQVGTGSTDTTRGAATINLQQPVLKNFWIDQTRMSILTTKNRLKYSEQQLKLTIMNTATKVEQAYYDLIYARENVKVQEMALELAQRLVAENKKRVEVGALAPLDERQAESQAATTEAALIAARSTLAIQENTLKQMLSEDYSSWASVELRPTETLTAPVRVFDRQISWTRGLSDRPDLLEAKLDIEAQGIDLKFRYNQLFPELDLIGAYGHNAGGVREFSAGFQQLAEGSLPNYYYGGQLSMPVGNVGARGAYRKSKLTKDQLVWTLKRLEQSVMVTIDNDIKQAQSSYQQVAATRAAREYAAEALDAEQKKLESGKSTTYTVLQMQRDLTSARGNEIQALANYNKNLSQLSLDEATTLERLGINLEVK